MQFGFDTESVIHGKSALLLYGMYRSRDENSSLSGLETWSRCAAYIRAAVLKSATVGEFVNHFCRKAQVSAIKPIHLKTDGLVKIDDAGTLAKLDGLYNYQLGIFETPEVLSLFANEPQYIIALVRERIQREKEKELFDNEIND